MDEIESLKMENDSLKDRLSDLAWELNYNKQTELLEFLRTLYKDVSDELKTPSKHTKKEVLFSLKKEIQEFAKYNKIML